MEVARSELATLIDAFLQDDQVALLRGTVVVPSLYLLLRITLCLDLFNKNPESNELLKHDAHLATRVACLFLKERTMGLGSKSAERQSPSPDMTHLLRSGKNFPVTCD
jgi:hypothetical protein